MLVVIALTSIVGLALLSMITFFYRSNAYVLEGTSAVDSASRGVDRALQSVREASYGEDGAYPVVSAATSSLAFYSDIDATDSVERVRLYVASGTLYQGVTRAAGNPPSYSGQAEAVSVIATSVRNASSAPVFRYFDAAGAELTGAVNAGSIRSVRVRLDVDINPQRAPNILTLQGSATLRNLRTE